MIINPVAESDLLNVSDSITNPFPVPEVLFRRVISYWFVTSIRAGSF